MSISTIFVLHANRSLWFQMKSYHDVVISGMRRLHNCSLTGAHAHTPMVRIAPSEGVVVTGTMHPYNLSVMSATATLPEVRRRNPALRILYYVVCVLLVALIAGVWWLYWIARR